MTTHWRITGEDYVRGLSIPEVDFHTIHVRALSAALLLACQARLTACIGGG